MLKKHSLLSAALRKYFRASALTRAGTALLLAGGPAAAEKPPDEVFAPTTQITLPSPQNITRFDISFVDPVIGQYFLADRTNKAVDVVDTATNTLLTQIKATPPFVGFTGNNDTSGPDQGCSVLIR